MDTSVLYSIKMFLGIDIANCAFDAQIIPYINMALGILRQLGVGEGEEEVVPSISGMEEVWSDVLGAHEVFLDMAKTFVGLQTKLYFDSPTNSFLVTSIQNMISELSWRIKNEVEELNRAS